MPSPRPRVTTPHVVTPRSTGLRVALVLASLYVSLGIVELALRIGHVHPLEIQHLEFEPGPPIDRSEVPPYFSYKPGYRGHQVYYACAEGVCGEDERIPFEINRAGFRDVDHDLAAEADRLRILCVGDSFTVADGVTLAEAWPARLEADLDGRLAKAPAVAREAVVSLSTWEQSVLLRQHAAELAPHLAVVQVYLNDALSSRWRTPEDQALQLVRADYQRDGWVSMPGANTFGGNHLPTRLYTSPLYLMRWVEAARFAARARGATQGWTRALWDDALNPLGLAEFDAGVTDIRRLAGEQGFRVLFVVFPTMDDLGPAYPYDDVHRSIVARIERAGVAALDLLPTLRAADPAVERFAHPSDHHPSPEMHALAAQAIADHLLAHPADFGLSE